MQRPLFRMLISRDLGTEVGKQMPQDLVSNVDDEAKKMKPFILDAEDGKYKSIIRYVKGGNGQITRSRHLNAEQSRAREEGHCDKPKGPNYEHKSGWDWVEKKEWIGKTNGEPKRINFSKVSIE